MKAKLNMLSIIIVLISSRVIALEHYSAEIPTQTVCDKIPIGSLDNTFICQLCPDFEDLDTLQLGNNNPFVKIKPKKSWELRNNYIGGTTTRLPRSRGFDFTPGSAIHLIDNDPETFWVVNTGENSAPYPWARIHFPKESTITGVQLWPMKAFKTMKTSLQPQPDGACFPQRIKIESTRDGVNWKTIYESTEPIPRNPSQPMKIKLQPHLALDVRVTATELADNPIWNPGVFSIKGFILAELAILDDKGNNLALASKGANVFVSATEYGYCLSRMVHDQLWPMHYDVGYKYLRLAYWDSVLNWHHVEKEKGIYRIDPHTDNLITEMVEYGIEPVLCLAYSNWLYTPEGQRPNPKTQYEVLYEMAPASFSIGSPMLEGYKNFVRFMVRHFKDRVKHFEIWNEPDVWGGGMSPEMYAGVVKEVVPIIRAEDPKAIIALGSVGGEWIPWKDEKGRDRGSHIRIRYEYLKEVLRQGIAPLIDTIGWHPLYGTLPDDPFYRNYPNEVKELKQTAENLGFTGNYMATEFAYWAKPNVPSQLWSNMGESCTQLVKSKYAARVLAMHAGMGIPVFWNETIEFAFRATSNGGLQGPYQPESVYYVIRNLCTAFDGVEPEPLKVELKPVEPLPVKAADGNLYYSFPREEPPQPIVCYTFKMPDGGSIVALWYDGLGSDDFQPIVIDCQVSLQVKEVIGVDILNGVTQKINYLQQKGSVVLEDLKITDYPLFINLN